MDTVKLQYLIADFNSKRQGWRELHTPENLAKSIAIEAAELLELTQWGIDQDEKKWESEIADIAIYLFGLCNVMDFNIADCIIRKLAINEKRYPSNDNRGHHE